MAALNIAFEAPECPRGAMSTSAKPIDLDHLASQTMGDPALEKEILRLFARQARESVAELAGADRKTAMEIAHRLKGAAKAVGAFSISQVAEEIEAGDCDAVHLSRIGAAVVEAENFILKLCR